MAPERFSALWQQNPPTESDAALGTFNEHGKYVAEVVGNALGNSPWRQRRLFQ